MRRPAADGALHAPEIQTGAGTRPTPVFLSSNAWRCPCIGLSSA
jgi:hypothetical protein